MGFRRFIVSITAVIAFSATQLCAYAQNWDSILDRYETICGECVRMRGIVDAGGRVSRRKISGLMTEITSLKIMLEDTSNSMSVSQRERFESIKRQYSGGGGVQPAVRTVAEKEPARQAPKISNQVAYPAASAVSTVPHSPDTASYYKKVVEIPQIEAPSAARIRTVTSSLPDRRSCVSAEFKEVGSRVVTRKCFDKFILAHCGVWPDLSFGGLFSMVHSESGWGGYISARSNFRDVKYDIECYSTDKDSHPSFSGNLRRARTDLSVGAVYSPARWAAIYAGAGYGGFNYYWETKDLKWARVADCCFSGFSLDCGVIFSFGIFSVGVGASTTAFKYSDLTVSLGARF